MRLRLAAILAAGLAALAAAAAPAQADHTETHVEETVTIDDVGPVVRTQPGYLTVDCAPQDATVDDPACGVDLTLPQHPYYACVPSPGPGCERIL